MVALAHEDHFGIVFIGPLPSGDAVLVVVDYYSHLRNSCHEDHQQWETIEVLKEIFARHGLPISVYSDNGRQFTSNAFAEYMQSMGKEHYRSPPAWPQANGEVERQNDSLEKRMRIAQAERKDWQT